MYTLAVVALLLATSCAAPATAPAPPAPPAKAEPTKAPAVSTKAPEPTKAPAAPTKAPEPTKAPAAPTKAQSKGIAITLTMWVVLQQKEYELIASQVKQFQDLNPDIRVELLNIPSADLVPKLMTAFAAGAPPDVASLWPDTLLTLAKAGHLLALDDRIAQVGLNWGDFLMIAGRSSLVDGKHYGLPWRQVFCTRTWFDLALSKNTKYPSEALRLAAFLVQEPRQKENFDALKWYPAHLKANDATTRCPNPDRTVGVLSEKEYESLRNTLNSRVSEFHILEDVQLKKITPDVTLFSSSGRLYPATGIFKPAAGDAMPELRAALIPARSIYDQSGCVIPEKCNSNNLFYGPIFAQELAKRKEIVVASLLVNDDNYQGAAKKAYGVLMTSDNKLVLVDDKGGRLAVKEPLFTDANGQAEFTDKDPLMQILYPYVTPLSGSVYICIYWDGYGGCIRLG
jgi:hypothetical protein